MKNDGGEMSMSNDSKQKAWLEHYRQHLNVVFDWEPDYLSDEPLAFLPSIPITNIMVLRKLSLEDEQSTGPIRQGSGDDTSSR